MPQAFHLWMNLGGSDQSAWREWSSTVTAAPKEDSVDLAVTSVLSELRNTEGFFLCAEGVFALRLGSVDSLSSQLPSILWKRLSVSKQFPLKAIQMVQALHLTHQVTLKGIVHPEMKMHMFLCTAHSHQHQTSSPEALSGLTCSWASSISVLRPSCVWNIINTPTSSLWMLNNVLLYSHTGSLGLSLQFLYRVVYWNDSEECLAANYSDICLLTYSPSG